MSLLKRETINLVERLVTIAKRFGRAATWKRVISRREPSPFRRATTFLERTFSLGKHNIAFRASLTGEV